MCQVPRSPVAPSVRPARRNSGGTWSTPETSPLAIEGTAPSRITANIIRSFSPSQITAGATHATDGSDWSPDRIGPMAARTSLTRATSSPSGVPMATASRKPSRPRETLVQTTSSSVPASHISRALSHTADGGGSL